MEKVVINNIGIWRQLIQLVRQIFPSQFIDFFRGPANSLVIGTSGTDYVKVQFSARRPIDIQLLDDVVVEQTVFLPRAARSDLSAAIVLAVEANLPFPSSELLISAFFVEETQGIDTFNIAVVKKTTLTDALLINKIAPSRIRSVLARVENSSRRYELLATVNSSPIKMLAHIWLPIGALGLSIFVALMSLIADQRAVNDDLKSSINQLSDQLVMLEQSETEYTADMGEIGGLLSALSKTMDPISALAAYQNGSSHVEVLTGIKFRDGALVLSIETSRILEFVTSLNNDMSDWRINVDGEISKTGVGDLERTEIVVIRAGKNS